MIRSAKPADAGTIAEIYNHYISSTVVTFEEEPVPDEQMEMRLKEVLRAYPWLVYEDNGSIAGYAYASKWHARSAYRRSAETTVYLDKSRVRKGIGSLLYIELLKLLKDAGFHTAIGGIALPNEGSVALHEKLGFAKAAHFKQVGWKFERRIDVGYWQLML